MIYDPRKGTYPSRVLRDLNVGPRGNLAAPWLHGPQPISHYPVRLGFSHPEGRYRPEGSTFSSPDFSWFRNIKLFLTREREIIVPRFGGISTWAREEAFAARWLRGPQSITHYPVGLGFPHPEGRYRPEGSTFSSPGFSWFRDCLLYTSPSPRDLSTSRMPSSA